MKQAYFELLDAKNTLRDELDKLNDQWYMGVHEVNTVEELGELDSKILGITSALGRITGALYDLRQHINNDQLQAWGVEYKQRLKFKPQALAFK